MTHGIMKYLAEFYDSWIFEDKITFFTFSGLTIGSVIMIQLRIPNLVFAGVIFGVLLAILFRFIKSPHEFDKNKENCDAISS